AHEAAAGSLFDRPVSKPHVRPAAGVPQEPGPCFFCGEGSSADEPRNHRVRPQGRRRGKILQHVRAQPKPICHNFRNHRKLDSFLRGAARPTRPRSAANMIPRPVSGAQPTSRIGTIPQIADSVWGPTSAAAAPAIAVRPRHSAVVRVTHWITTLSFLALLVSGVEVLISHPRFYWGEAGNVLTPPLFKLPIPASRATVPTGYGYVLPDQNGWSRYLHFQSAWVAVLTGLLYVGYGFFAGHFRRNLLPDRADLSRSGLSSVVARHLRFKPARAEEVWSYNVLQRVSYLLVIFILFPLIIWT